MSQLKTTPFKSILQVTQTINPISLTAHEEVTQPPFPTGGLLSSKSCEMFHLDSTLTLREPSGNPGLAVSEPPGNPRCPPARPPPSAVRSSHLQEDAASRRRRSTVLAVSVLLGGSALGLVQTWPRRTERTGTSPGCGPGGRRGFLSGGRPASESTIPGNASEWTGGFRSFCFFWSEYQPDVITWGSMSSLYSAAEYGVQEMSSKEAELASSLNVATPS